MRFLLPALGLSRGPARERCGKAAGWAIPPCGTGPTWRAGAQALQTRSRAGARRRTRRLREVFPVLFSVPGPFFPGVICLLTPAGSRPQRRAGTRGGVRPASAHAYCGVTAHRCPSGTAGRDLLQLPPQPPAAPDVGQPEGTHAGTTLPSPFPLLRLLSAPETFPRQTHGCVPRPPGWGRSQETPRTAPGLRTSRAEEEELRSHPCRARRSDAPSPRRPRPHPKAASRASERELRRSSSPRARVLPSSRRPATARSLRRAGGGLLSLAARGAGLRSTLTPGRAAGPSHPSTPQRFGARRLQRYRNVNACPKRTAH